MASLMKIVVFFAFCALAAGFSGQLPTSLPHNFGQICRKQVQVPAIPLKIHSVRQPLSALRMAEVDEEEEEVEDDIPLEVRMDALRRMRKFKEIQSGQTELQSGNYRETDTPIEMDIRKVKEIIDESDDEDAPLLLDVREESEYDFCRIDGSVLIPLSTMRERCIEIPKDRLVLVYCHHGMRSMQVVRYLRTRGWTKVSNVKGGIDEWSIRVDPAVPRY
jgi:rhodanese-related sulfurtransferase